MPASLKVTLIGETASYIDNVQDVFWDTEFGQRTMARKDQDGDELVEFAGRACYQSWDMPNPDTANNEGYLKNILAQEHFSVLEHANFTFYIEGVSRSLTHELVRHRHLSFSQLSQRYVDQSELDYVIPPALRDHAIARHRLNDHWRDSLLRYEGLVETLINDGYKRKETRQAARAVLPEMTETKIVVTGNGSAWRHFLKKRNHPAADAEIRELAQEIQKQLIGISPNLFKDLEELNG